MKTILNVFESVKNEKSDALNWLMGGFSKLELNKAIDFLTFFWSDYLDTAQNRKEYAATISDDERCVYFVNQFYKVIEKYPDCISFGYPENAVTLMNVKPGEINRNTIKAFQLDDMSKLGFDEVPGSYYWSVYVGELGDKPFAVLLCAVKGMDSYERKFIDYLHTYFKNTLK